jgi:SAM-dependent methyltransferase
MFHRFVLDEEWNHRRFSKWMSADAIKQFGLNHGADAELDFNSGVNDVEHILRLRRLVGKSPVTILDFGCGFGHFLQVCLHFAFDATGIDRSSGRRERGLVKIFPSLDDVQGRQFDAITLFQVLEHLDEPATVLKSLANSLKSGGYLILETPNCAGMIGINTMRDYRNAHPLEHINCFTHETLRSIAERRGFELIRRGPAFVTAQPYRVLKRIARHALLQDGKATDLYFRKH